jgi:mannose-6-phosphate isomerase
MIILKSGLCRLTGKIQNYAWGGHAFLPQLVAGKQRSPRPCAEFWLGAHLQAPSQLIGADGGSVSLADVIADQPDQVLGPGISQRYGRLPFLLKVLDVKDALSLQVHPCKRDAEAGFKRENDLGIPLDSPLRNYRDDNHKPELMVALSDFWLLHGFQPEERLAAVLTQIPELRGFKPYFEHGGYEALYQHVMEMPHSKIKAINSSLLSRLVDRYRMGGLRKSAPDYWVARIAASSPVRQGDPGLLCLYFLNLVHLKKGEAIFQDAGILHAYLQGQNVEIMANSDNVLRGGLTDKHIDPAELMKRTRFEGIQPRIIQRTVKNWSSEGLYPSPAPDFALSEIHLGLGDLYPQQTRSLEILFALSGEAKVTASGHDVLLNAGQSAVVFAGRRYAIKALTDNVSLFRASVPKTEGNK